ncbi:DUF2818 family protein [Castellaniella sp.]|uniref:DUF2818 family protein n=1 Tax=Castellaniella sp. TaxID=1955812 RepID=UPI002AFE2C2A|nr:DUF2818 family protein [Castellaniella sp.]
MPLDFSVWLVILGALALANLPFLIDRPLAPWPWGRTLQSFGGLMRWVSALGFLALLALWAWGTLRLVGGAFGGVGNLFFIVKLLVSLVLLFVLLSLPGILARTHQVADTDPALRGKPIDPKPFIDRFLEALVGYLLIGTIGFTLELDLGNAFPQGWEFYAVTLALFLVLGYPGFVWHYLLQRRRR